MKLELEYTKPSSAAARWVQNRNAWEAPRLPSLGEDAVRRWAGGPTWIPPGTIPLVRHRSHDGARCVVTTGRVSPKGFDIEYDLGIVHEVAQPGTQRLIGTDDGDRYFVTPFEGELDEGYRGLGYVEQAPLPMLDALELRRDPVTERHVLVAGTEDPLYETAVFLGLLGFVESYPINPRRTLDPQIEWCLSTLVRSVDSERWRHCYEVTDQRRGASVALGGVWQRPGPGFVALCRSRFGRLSTELAQSICTMPGWAAKLRWGAAPLGWTKGRPRAWAVRAAGGRMRRLAVEQREGGPSPVYDAGSTIVGYLKRSPAVDWSPLYSAIHPALGDQYITRSKIEATDLGYQVEGLLGYALDRPADQPAEMFQKEIKWGSRFGQRRRYIEGGAPD